MCSAVRPSRRDRSNRSDTSRARDRAATSIWAANWGTLSGAFSSATCSVSAEARIELTGVLSSWEALVTKSRRTSSTRRRSVMSDTTTSARPSSKGDTITRSTRAGRPCSRSMSTTVRLVPGPPHHLLDPERHHLGQCLRHRPEQVDQGSVGIETSSAASTSSVPWGRASSTTSSVRRSPLTSSRR
jgi:hypothetical protein